MRLQLTGMAQDFSWAGPAQKYRAIYEALVQVQD
jgi:glycogen synthase